MGVFNSSSFGNDTALDFASEVQSFTDLERKLQQGSEHSDAIDATLASELIAVADIVAAMAGRPAPDMPDELADKVPKFGKPNTQLIESACHMINRVRENSELADLWQEDDALEWLDALDDLEARLDLDTPYTAVSKEPDTEFGLHCRLCNGPIDEADLVAAELEMAGMVGVKMTHFLHRDCIVAQFKPPHFDKNGQPDKNVINQLKALSGL